jgi:LPS-assembly lipoprotein
MSSPDTGRRLLVLAALAAALPLGGCFQPLYGEASIGGGSVEAALRDIVVDPVPDRIGHYIVQELGFALNGSGEAGKARYRLSMTVKEQVQATIVNTTTGSASAATVLVDVDFKLVTVDGGKVVIAGKAYGSASYDRNSQRFASLRAARDAEIRIAKTIADQMRTRLAARFATGT